MRIRMIAIFMFFGFLIIPSNVICEEKKIKIFYLPFEIQTYMPMTIDNIEEYACIFEIPESSKDIELLRKLVERGIKGEFYNSLVRLKVIKLFNDDVFVDAEGGILRENGKRIYRLDQDGFAKLKILMKKFAKQYGCN